MTQKEKTELEYQKAIDWQRFEEDKIKECKIIPFSIVYPDKEVNVIIVEKG